MTTSRSTTRVVRRALVVVAACGGALAACAEGEPGGPLDAARRDGSIAMDARPAGDAPSGDATPGDASPAPPDAPPSTMPDATLAGTYTIAAPDFDIAPDGSRRVVDLAFDPHADAFVAVYVWEIGPGNFRSEARGITVGGASPLVGAPTLVDDAPPGVTHNSAEASVACASGGTESLCLAVFADDRLGNGNGFIDIYGQRFRVTAGPGGAAPSVATVGPVFDISQIAPTNEALPDVAYEPGTNGFFVVWADDRERGVRDENARVVYGRTVSAAGVVGPEVRLGDNVAFQTMPQVEASPAAHRYLVVWSDFVVDASGTILIQYRARVVDAATGNPVAPIFPVVTGIRAPPDQPAVAYNARRDEWLVGWNDVGPPSIRQTRGAVVSAAGAVARGPFALTSQPDGALQPRLAYARATNSYLLSFHAQDSAQAYALELDAAGNPVGASRATNPAPPPLGTFFTSVAADATRARFLVARTVDYRRIGGTLFTAPAVLPGP